MQNKEGRILTGRIKMRQLQLLDELSRSGSVFHAAEVLGMSQSAASRLLAGLEEELGVALFERHARGVVPTPSGAIVTRRAASALSEIARAAAEVGELKRGRRTPLSIGCLLSQSTSYFPTALLRLSERAPDLLVQAHVERSRTLIDGLKAARYDLVIARVRDAALESDLIFEPLGPEPVGVYARVGHPLASRRKPSLQDLAQCTWILPPPETDMRARMDALCARHGLPLLSGFIETLSAPLILSVLRASDALVALPTQFARPFCDDRSIVQLRVAFDVQTENLGMVTRRHHGVSPALRVALSVFQEVARVSWSDAPGRPATVARR